MLVHLLEFREKLKKIYSKYDRYFLMVLRFLFTLTGLMLLAAVGRTWVPEAAAPFAALVVVSLVCAFLPDGMISVVFCAFILRQIYAVSMEAFLVGIILFMLMVLLYYAFRPHNSIIMAVSLILCLLGVPQGLYLWLGLFCAPYALVPACFGVVAASLIQLISESLAAFAKSGSFSVTLFVQLLGGLFADRELYFRVAAAIFATMSVYLLARCSFHYARYIASVVGSLVHLLIRLAAMLVLRQDILLWSEVVWTVISAAAVLILSFLVFAEDYSRVEYARFEDDDYYYYVKAVPKMTVALSETKVKKISGQVKPEDMDETKSFTAVK